ncbi:MAG: galactokinase family protein [Bacteroidota bacterium]
MNVKALNAKFEEYFGKSDRKISHFLAPGCLKLMGDHVDYNGGSVLTINTPMGIIISISEREDDLINLQSTTENKVVEININDSLKFNPTHGWGNYPVAVIKYLKLAEMPLKGANILFTGDLPSREGLGASAAIEVATGFAMMHLMAKKIDRVALALLCHHAHNEFFDDYSGIGVHFGITNGKAGHALELDTQNLKTKHIEFDTDPFEVLVITPGLEREGHSGIGDKRKDECFRALMILKQKMSIQYLCDATFSDAEDLIEDEVLSARARHVVWENQYVFEASEAIEERSWGDLGESFDASHLSLAGDFQVSSEELDLLVDIVRMIDGCIGAKMTGDHESGSVLALVLKEHFDNLKAIVTERFQAIAGLTPDFFHCTPCKGVHIIK